MIHGCIEQADVISCCMLPIIPRIIESIRCKLRRQVILAEALAGLPQSKYCKDAVPVVADCVLAREGPLQK